MAKKINTKSKTNSMNNILNLLDKPKFIYDEPFYFDELYEKIKKKPINLPRSITCLSIFFILNILYFGIIERLFKLHFCNFIITPIFFIVSILLTKKIAIKSIYKLIDSKNKFYFYDSFLIVESENSVKNIYYNNILSIKENKNNYSFITKFGYYYLDKNKIDDNFYNFLKELTIRYKQIETSTKDKLFWDYLHEKMNNYKMYCINNKNEQSLNNYYHTKKIFFKIFIYFFCIEYFIGIYIMHDLMFVSFKDFIFCIIYFFVLVISSIYIYIKKKIKIILQEPTEKLYFYDKFFLIKNENQILKYDYDNIKTFIEDEDKIYIKTELLSPIIINKSDLTLNKFDLSSKNKKFNN